jgi:hypothetical protein
MIYYVVINYINGNIEYFVDETEAKIKHEFYKEEYLQQEKDRFVISYDIEEGSNTVWVSFDPDNQPEIGDYQVFNHMTGGYSLVHSKTEAILLREQHIQQFIVDLGLDIIPTTDQIPIPPPPPPIGPPV